MHEMLVGILSDTHDQRKRTETAVAMLRDAGAETLIHCGDLVEPDLIGLCTVMPFCLVFGNNDCHNVAEIQAALKNADEAVCLGWGGEIELAGKRFAVTHGHLHKVYQQLMVTKPDYLLSGHTHVAMDSGPGATRFINPGALHRASPFTVALLDLKDDRLQFLEVPR
jgi:putative phosphoesterase